MKYIKWYYNNTGILLYKININPLYVNSSFLFINVNISSDNNIQTIYVRVHMIFQVLN